MILVKPGIATTDIVPGKERQVMVHVTFLVTFCTKPYVSDLIIDIGKRLVHIVLMHVLQGMHVKMNRPPGFSEAATH